MTTAEMPQVITEIVSGSGMGLGKAAALLAPTRGERVHQSTLSGWIRRGAKTPDGRTVRLEAAKIGDRWLTSTEAIARFMAALTPAGSASAEQSKPSAQPAKRTKRLHDAAVKRLVDAGA